MRPRSYRSTKVMFMIPVLMAAVTAFGQSSPGLQLNNYTIPVGKAGAVVGQFHDQQGIAKAVKLVEDTSGLFDISRKGEMKLKKKTSLANNGAAFKFAVTVESNGTREHFILVKDNFIRNKVVAHRGAWKNNAGSQNSLTSLRDAIRIGCEGSEFDVWLSSDGVPMISHDPHIGGKKLEETPAAELGAIDLKNGDKVPSLEAYIGEIMKQNNTRLVLEIKPSGVSKERGQQLAQTCMDIIRRHNAQAWMYYISFDYDICKKIAALDPFAKVAYLNGDKTPAELKADKIWGFDYNWKIIDDNMNIFKDARKNDVTVNIWTVNKPEQMDTYLKAGTDYLTTDEPEMLLQKVK